MTGLCVSLGSLAALGKKYKLLLALVFLRITPYFSSFLPLVPAHLPTAAPRPLELSTTSRELPE